MTQRRLVHENKNRYVRRLQVATGIVVAVAMAAVAPTIAANIYQAYSNSYAP